MPRQLPRLALAAHLAVALAAGGCALTGRAGVTAGLRGTVALDRSAVPPAVLLVDPDRGTWRLDGPLASDLRELDRALVEVRGSADPTGPLRDREPGRFLVHVYRLVQVGGLPAMVGRLAWDGPSLVLVELDRDDQRVPLAGPAVSRLPVLMGKTIWVAGYPRQGSFVVERHGVLREGP